MSRKILLVLVAGAVASAITIWFTLPSSSTFISDPSKYHFMYCPHCGKEQKFDVDKYVKGCPKCGSDFVPTEESIAVSGRPLSRYSKTFLWLMVELVAVMAGILFVTRRRAGMSDEPYVYTNCEQCRQRIRYRERQIGNSAMCPRCRKPFVYPEVDGEE